MILISLRIGQVGEEEEVVPSGRKSGDVTGRNDYKRND